jgi:predicted dehydrogenase
MTNPARQKGSSMVRIGLIGLGRHGIRYARHAAAGEIPGAELTAVWRRDREQGERLADELDVRFEPSVEALIAADDVDAIVIVVPVALHAELALKVAAAKKPLLLEKPLARSLEEAARIRQAFDSVHVPLMIAQTLRFDPLVSRLRARAHEVGDLRGFRFEQRIEPRGLAWEDDLELAGGGVLIQTGIHTLDALRYVTGADRIRVRHAELARMQYRNAEDHAVVLLDIEGSTIPNKSSAAPVLGDVATSKIGRSRHLRLTLFLESCALEADLVRRTLSEIHGRETTSIEVPEEPTVVAAFSAFIRCVRDGAPNPVTAEDAMRSLALVEAAYRASMHGR